MNLKNHTRRARRPARVDADRGAQHYAAESPSTTAPFRCGECQRRRARLRWPDPPVANPDLWWGDVTDRLHDALRALRGLPPKAMEHTTGTEWIEMVRTIQKAIAVAEGPEKRFFDRIYVEAVEEVAQEYEAEHGPGSWQRDFIDLWEPLA